jgi:hypothetical protein
MSYSAIYNEDEKRLYTTFDGFIDESEHKHIIYILNNLISNITTKFTWIMLLKNFRLPDNSTFMEDMMYFVTITKNLVVLAVVEDEFMTAKPQVDPLEKGRNGIRFFVNERNAIRWLDGKNL